MLGTPYFDKVTLHLENGRRVVITTDNNSADNRYIQSMTVNGQPYDKNYLTHADLTAGMRIAYTMAAEPNKQRGTSEEAAPYSFSKDEPAPVKGKGKKAKR